MSDQTSQGPEGPGDDFGPRVETAGAPGKSSKTSAAVAFVQKKAFWIVGAIVLLMVLMVMGRGCSREEVVQQRLGVAPQEARPRDPQSTADYVAESVKERDAAIAKYIGEQPRAITSGAAFMPQLTREWDDPLADYASATSRSQLAETTVSAQMPPLPTPEPQTPRPAQRTQLEQQAGSQRAKILADAMGRLGQNVERSLVVNGQPGGAEGRWQPPPPAAAGALATAGGAQQAPARKLANLGDLIYAVMDFEANSDHSRFVQATAVAGPYTGAKFQGNFRPTSDRLEIVFSRVNWRNQTYKFAAIAVNPEQPEVGLATDVNRHYITRYGGLVLATFASAIGADLSRQGTRIVRGPFGDVDIEQQRRSTDDLLLIGAGAVGTELAQEFRQHVGRPPTIIVAASTPIGIVLTEDWLDERSQVEPARTTTAAAPFEAADVLGAARSAAARGPVPAPTPSIGEIQSEDARRRSIRTAAARAAQEQP